MTQMTPQSIWRQHCRISPIQRNFLLLAGAFLIACGANAETNLLQNSGFEEPVDTSGNPPRWSVPAGQKGIVKLIEGVSHSGKRSLQIPPHAAIEQKVQSTKAGAYLARAWVKSEAAQSVALLIEDTNQPWAGYTYAEIKIPANEWTMIEGYCSLEKDGSLTVTLGELSGDFRNYHGVGTQMRSAIVVDDMELVRCQADSGSLNAWTVKRGDVKWAERSKWPQVETLASSSSKACVIQSRNIAGVLRAKDGSLEISSILDGQLKPRCVLVPSIPIPNARCSLVTTNDKKGFRISSKKGDHAYTAWFTKEGLITISAEHIPQFEIKDCRLRYGLLPSFVGTDLLYAPRQMQGSNDFNVPSTQWLVGLVDGNDSMLVAVWESDTQAVALGLSGDGDNRMIDTVRIATTNAGFSLSVIEHTNIWHQKALKEEWLAQYVPIEWQRPFQARWMCQFFVRPSTKPTFRQPNLFYSFPAAYARTRHWGVWFEDTNFYPFYFDGLRTMLHFDKTYVPNGDALIYFLEPAASDLYSPCEIVEQALGHEKAQSLFSFDAYQLRKLSYSTPDEFIYDRPVCATTTRLNSIKHQDKATVGVNLATHLYEFIREIRGRIDQYGVFLADMRSYLETQKTAHPELADYITEMDNIAAEAQGRSKLVYTTPLPAVLEKTEKIKKLLIEGTDDGFTFGALDCRGTAGGQDDLCRHYNRFVMQWVQTAASKCGDSPQKAAIAKHIWDQSREILQRPTRWESRRTVYFLEP